MKSVDSKHMGTASKYWQQVRLDSRGQRSIEEIAAAKEFFHRQFVDSSRQSDRSYAATLPELSDTTIQRQLMQLWHAPTDQQTRTCADRCLRCYISNQILLVCLHLESQFGKRHGFTCNELLTFVLDDAVLQRRSSLEDAKYQSLATKILESFDPERGSLSTWVTQFVKQHPDLNKFLLQQGVYLISDWAILNDTTVAQLERIFSEFHALTKHETQQTIALLQSYHRVYRQDRLRNRGKQKRGCIPPDDQQLQRIADDLHQTLGLMLSPKRILSQLQNMATRLRQYRIYVRGGHFPVDSIDRPEIGAIVADQSAIADDTLEAQNEFLSFYEEQFMSSFEQTLLQVVNDRLSYLQRKRPPQDQQFLTALHLFHCQGKSMGEMAEHLGLQAQYQVSRLLKLKELRSDIHQRFLRLLLDRVLDKAKNYADSEKLQSLEQQIEAALDERISQIMQQAEAEANIPKNRPLDSLFVRSLCGHLATIKKTL